MNSSVPLLGMILRQTLGHGYKEGKNVHKSNICGSKTLATTHMSSSGGMAKGQNPSVEYYMAIKKETAQLNPSAWMKSQHCSVAKACYYKIHTE